MSTLGNSEPPVDNNEFEDNVGSIPFPDIKAALSDKKAVQGFFVFLKKTLLVNSQAVVREMNKSQEEFKREKELSRLDRQRERERSVENSRKDLEDKRKDRQDQIKDKREDQRRDRSNAIGSVSSNVAGAMTKSLLGPLGSMFQDLTGFDIGDKISNSFTKAIDKPLAKADELWDALTLTGKGSIFKGGFAEEMDNSRSLAMIERNTRRSSEFLEDSSDFNDEMLLRDKLKMAGGKDGKLSGPRGLNLGGLFDTGAIKKALASMVPGILNAAGVGLIAAGVLGGVMDGLATMGKAKEWGVSDAAAFMGGFIAGKGEGWDNALKNAPKWAAIMGGAGLLAFGPVGGIVGALLGAVLGGIAGFIGPEKVAWGIQSAIEWAEKNPMWAGLIMGAGLGGLVGSLGGPVGAVVGAVLGSALGGIAGYIGFDFSKEGIQRGIDWAKTNPGWVGMISGAGLGAFVGGSVGGPVGILVGAIVGAALGGIAGNILRDFTPEGIQQGLKWAESNSGWIGMIAGSGLGAAVGSLGGPIGTIAGVLVGAALGGIAGVVLTKMSEEDKKKLLAFGKSNLDLLAVMGAGAAGFAFAGPMGMVAGAILGGALTGIVKGMDSGVSMTDMMQFITSNPKIMVAAGAMVGGGVGLAAFKSPVALVAGIILGAAIGGIISALNNPNAQIENDIWNSFQTKKSDTLATYSKKITEVTNKFNSLKDATARDEYLRTTVRPLMDEMNKAVTGNANVQTFDFNARDAFLGPKASVLEMTQMFESATKGKTSVQSYLDQMYKGAVGKDYAETLSKNNPFSSSDAFEWIMSGESLFFRDKAGRDIYAESKSGSSRLMTYKSVLQRAADAEGLKFGELINSGKIGSDFNSLTGKEGEKKLAGYLSNLIGSGVNRFHSGGLSRSEQFAILRRDEEVLSPAQSRQYQSLLDRSESVNRIMEKLATALSSLNMVDKPGKKSLSTVVNQDNSRKSVKSESTVMNIMTPSTAEMWG